MLKENFKINKVLALFTAFVITSGFTSCSTENLNTSSTQKDSTTQTNTQVTSQSTETLKAPTEFEVKSVVDSGLVTANTKFGLNLYSKILEQGKDKNIFISPLSVSIALSMTFNGSDGTTKDDMAKALQFSNMTLDNVNAGNEILKRKLETVSSGVQVNIANSLWGNKDFVFPSKFVEDNNKFYDAKLTSLDFSKKESVDAINKWVSDSTNKKIEKMVEQIDPATFLYLINAIYFKGTWTDKFDKDLTTDANFTLVDGKQKTVSMMERMGEFRYLEKAGEFQAIKLPYGESQEVSMYVFLPAKESNLTNFNKSLTSENLEAWFTQFKTSNGLLDLPKFKLEYELILNDSLKALGMSSAFDSNANFTKLGGGFISEVKHKSFVDVNEEGTEAAAATSVAITKTSMPLEKPFNMIVDRPFVFAIVDGQTNSILFMGNIVEPK